MYGWVCFEFPYAICKIIDFKLRFSIINKAIVYSLMIHVFQNSSDYFLLTTNPQKSSTHRLISKTSHKFELKNLQFINQKLWFFTKPVFSTTASLILESSLLAIQTTHFCFLVKVAVWNIFLYILQIANLAFNRSKAVR